MINLDKPEYKELATRIVAYRSRGHNWEDSQRIALADMKRRYNWQPK